MLDLSSGNIFISEETFGKEYVHLIDKQHLWAFISVQVDFGLGYCPVLKDKCRADFSDLTLSVNLHLCHLIEGTVLNQVLETKLSEHRFKAFIVSLAEVLAVAGTLDLEAIECKNYAHYCKYD